MLFSMRQNWWVAYRDMEFSVSMPNFTLQKGEGCLVSVVEKVIMKMQKKTQRHTRGLAAQFIDSTTRWNDIYCVVSTLG